MHKTDFKKNTLTMPFKAIGLFAIILASQLLVSCTSVGRRVASASSMSPTIEPGDLAVMTKPSIPIQRGDIVTINSPYLFDKALAGAPADKNKYGIWCKSRDIPFIGYIIRAVAQEKDLHCQLYLKRIIGLPGDSIVVNAEGKVSVNGSPLKEGYVSKWCTGNAGSCRTFTGTVPKRSYFVLGDNRGDSWDSRYWPSGGFVHEKYILETLSHIQKRSEAKHNGKRTETKKDPKITAAEQLFFVLCKKNLNQFKKHHDEDMRKILSMHRIDSSILETSEVKNLAQKYIDDGGCELAASYERISDVAGEDKDGKSQFINLIGWQREVIALMSEGECSTQIGEFNSQERESYLIEKFGQISFPNELSDADMQAMIKDNLSTIIWMTKEKMKKENCSWRPM